MRKVLVLSIGIITACFALNMAKDYFFQLGLDRGEIMCTDILNNCANYCEAANKISK